MNPDWGPKINVFIYVPDCVVIRLYVIKNAYKMTKYAYKMTKYAYKMTNYAYKMTKYAYKMTKYACEIMYAYEMTKYAYKMTNLKTITINWPQKLGFLEEKY